MTAEPLFDVESATITPAAADAAARLTERDMLDLLHKRFGQQSYNGAVQADRYVRAEHVRARAGFDTRTCDFVAVDTWASSRFAVHGVEVKVSRSDWQRELKDPAKSEPFRAWCSYWWLAVPHLGVARPDELPPGWGLLLVQGGRLIAKVKAPRTSCHPVPMETVASLLRATAKTAARRTASGSYVVKLGATGTTHGLFTKREADVYAAEHGMVTSNFITPVLGPGAVPDNGRPA